MQVWGVKLGKAGSTVPHRLRAVAEAVEQHGQDLDNVRLKQAAQLLAEALKRQQGACRGNAWRAHASAQRTERGHA